MKKLKDIKEIGITMSILDEQKISKKVDELMRKREKMVFELDNLRLELCNKQSGLLKKVVMIDKQIEKARKGRVIKK